MSNLQVRNVADDMHEELRRRASQLGVSISEYLLELIRRDLRRPARSQWLDEVARLPRRELDRATVSRAVDDGRDGRDQR